MEGLGGWVDGWCCCCRLQGFVGFFGFRMEKGYGGVLLYRVMEVEKFTSLQ